MTLPNNKLLFLNAGHEFPFAIKMNHMREAALTDEDGFPFDFDQQLPSIDPLSPETQCQFILKRNRKIPNRVIIGETGGDTHTGNKSAERSDAVKLAAFISVLRLGLDKFCRQNFKQNKRFLTRAFCRL